MIGAVPVQVPSLVVSVLPSSGVPETAGGDWFEGAACGADSATYARAATAASTTSVPASAVQRMVRRFMFRPLPCVVYVVSRRVARWSRG